MSGIYHWMLSRAAGAFFIAALLIVLLSIIPVLVETAQASQPPDEAGYYRQFDIQWLASALVEGLLMAAVPFFAAALLYRADLWLRHAGAYEEAAE